MKISRIYLFLYANFVATIAAYYRKCYEDFSLCLITNNTVDRSLYWENKFRLDRFSADKWCKNHSSSLAIITNETVQSAIAAFINDSSAELSSDVVTNGHRFTENTWRWTSGRQPDIYANSTADYRYAYLVVSTDRSFVSFFGHATSNRKFICSYFKHNSRCPAGHQQLKSRCYNMHDEVVTWFDARSICLKKQGSDLATFEDGIPSITSEWRRPGEYWIGLRRERWAWLNAYYAEINYNNWEAGKPRATEDDCLCLSVITGKWINCHCSRRFRYVCIQDYASGSASAMIASTTTITTTATKPATTTTNITTTVTKATTRTKKPTTTTEKATTTTEKATTTTEKATTTTKKPTTTTKKPTTTTEKPTTKMTTTTATRKTTQSTTSTIPTVDDSSSQFHSTPTQTLNNDSEQSSGMILALGIGSALLLILIVVIAVVVFVKNRRSRSGDVGPRNGNSQSPTMHNDDVPNTVYAVVMPNANEPVRTPSEKTSNQTVYAELDLEPKSKITKRASEPVLGPSEKASNQAVYAEVGLAPKGNRGTTHERGVPESEYANSSLVDSVYANSAQTKV